MGQEIERENVYIEELDAYLKDKIDLILVTYNRLEFTKLTLKFLFSRTTTPYRLIIVDNGSTDGTVEYLQQLQAVRDVDIIFLKRNYGLEHARAMALVHVQSRYHVYFDNDLVCPLSEPDWLARQIVLMDKHLDFGAMAMRPQVLVGTKINEEDECEIVANNHVGATFLIMRTDLMKEIGWRTTFTNRHADPWFAQNFRRLAGEGKGKSGWVKDMWCYHFFHENWGYSKDQPHYHRDVWPTSEHYDRTVDPITLVPTSLAGGGVSMFTWDGK